MVQALRESNPLEPIPFQIEEIREESLNCFTLTIACGDTPFSFQPGQFNMLYVFGHGEVPISVSGDPAKSHSLVHTIRNVGSVTAALQRLKAGDTVGVRGPFGNSWPLEAIKGKDILVVAGGLGIAPLRPALYHLLANRDDYGNVTLLYGTRTPNTLLFGDELGSWAELINMELTVDSADANWQGHVGIITELLEVRDINPASTVALLCGPEIMMRFCAYALLEKGLDAMQIYLSMERNMKCAIGQCGRCQYGPFFICKDGPVFSFDKVKRLFGIREI